MTGTETERLTLRLLAREDAREVIGYHKLPEVTRYQSWEPKTEGEIELFANRMGEAEFLDPGQWFQYVIVSREEGKIVGDCGVQASIEDRRQVTIGITLIPDYQGRGYAAEAIRSVLRILFDETDTHRVFASIDPRNGSSLRLFENLGFRKEAHHVESLWFRGEWVDDVIFAMLRNEWGEAIDS